MTESRCVNLTLQDLQDFHKNQKEISNISDKLHDESLTEDEWKALAKKSLDLMDAQAEIMKRRSV